MVRDIEIVKNGKHHVFDVEYDIRYENDVQIGEFWGARYCEKRTYIADVELLSVILCTENAVRGLDVDKLSASVYDAICEEIIDIES